MLKCPTCGKQFPDGAKFCDACGTKLPDTITCPACGEETSRSGAFCEQCGKPLAKPAEPAVAAAAPAPGAPRPKEKTAAAVKTAPHVSDTPAPAEPKKKKGSAKKAILIGGLVVVLVVVIIAAAALLLPGGGKADNFALYIKERSLSYTTFQKDGDLDITTRLFSSSDEIGYYGEHVGYLTALSEDGSKIFYPEKFDKAHYEGVTLYYRFLNNPKKEPVKVDSGVTNYVINENGTAIVYTKGYPDEGYTLYYSDFKEKVKISDNVTYQFFVSADLKKAVYQRMDGNCYYWYPGKESVKFASEVVSLQHVAEDFSTVYYTKGDALYKHVEGGDGSEKLISGIHEIVAIYDTGEVYFERMGTKEITLYDYIKDDMLETDASTTAPAMPPIGPEPSYPSYSDYDSDEEYYAAVDQYYLDLDMYWDEVNRIEWEYRVAEQDYERIRYRAELRDILKNTTYSMTNTTLCYYDGTNETVVTEQLESWMPSPTSPVILYYATELKSEPVIAMHEFGDYYYDDYFFGSFDFIDDLGYDIVTKLSSAGKPYIAMGSSVTSLDMNFEIDSVQFSPDGKSLFVLDAEVEGDLYKISLEGNQPGAPELYDSEVSIGNIYFKDNRLFYYKDIHQRNGSDPYGPYLETYLGELYVDKALIDVDVKPMAPEFIGDSVLFLTGDDTLMISSGGSKSRVCDDVWDYAVTPGGDVLIISDFSENSKSGSLYLYKNDKREKVADDVTALVHLIDAQLKGIQHLVSW